MIFLEKKSVISNNPDVIPHVTSTDRGYGSEAERSSVCIMYDRLRYYDCSIDMLMQL